MKWGQKGIQIRMLRYESTQCPRECLLLLDETSKLAHAPAYRKGGLTSRACASCIARPGMMPSS